MSYPKYTEDDCKIQKRQNAHTNSNHDNRQVEEYIPYTSRYQHEEPDTQQGTKCLRQETQHTKSSAKHPVADHTSTR